jgi:hypothetical protein
MGSTATREGPAALVVAVAELLLRAWFWVMRAAL